MSRHASAVGALILIRRLRTGLFEDVLTSALEAEVNSRQSEGWWVKVDNPGDADRTELLAQHVHQVVSRSLEAIGKSGQSSARDQVELVNRIIELLFEHDPDNGERIVDEARLLLEAVENPGLAKSDSMIPRPLMPLRRTDLLVNGRNDVQIAGAISREIPSADRIDLLCAFVRHSGVRLFLDELTARVQDGAKLRVITTVYTGSTERRALDALVKIGAEVKVSYDVSRTRLHAKAWLFHRQTGLHTAYIGSSNLTHSAQIDGLEWNVRVSAIDNPVVVDRFEATFEQYWQEPEFEDYVPETDADRLDMALLGDRGEGDTGQPIIVDVAPKPHQVATLEALDAERRHGHFRNLVVAATGTGKTWIAAFDFKRLLEETPGLSLLFVAHRMEILEQSQRVFQLVLRDPSFGEKLVAGERPRHGRHVFASIQSLARLVDTIDPNGFDVVVVDEFHHAAAESYDRLLNRLNPQILLGLTATPERTDGQSVLGWFDNRIASESRLWDALDQGLLCPFHYFGVNDTADLSAVEFRRGRYVQGEIDKVLTGDHVRARRICDAVEKIVSHPHEMRALGFCAGVGHAHFMAAQYTRFGYPAVALDGTTPADERRAVREKLRRGEIRAIFTVDLFNEGIDLPEVDTLLMLRPTESATIFLQQLGRGLRWNKDKSVLTVLDFVGQVHREYRYDVRYLALLGGTRSQLIGSIENDFPTLPPGCSVKLDRIAKNTVLNNLKQATRNLRARLADDLRSLGPATRLRDFMNEADAGLDDIYARPTAGHCFAKLRYRVGFDVDEPEKDLAKAIGGVRHADDLERITTWQEILSSNHANRISALQGRMRRFGLMLFDCLGKQNQSIDEADGHLGRILGSRALRHEIEDLLDHLADRIRTVSRPLYPQGDMPLASHATYTHGEVFAAYGRFSRNGQLLRPREGVLWDERTQTDLLFITLDKSDKRFSPTARLQDYPISRELFHWESQNKTSPDNKTGKRYIKQGTGSTNVILFVRERKKDEAKRTLPYHCLGRARYVSHESERPMKILWKLEEPMPEWLYQHGRLVAG